VTLLGIGLVSCTASSPWPDQPCPQSIPPQNEINHRIDLLKSTMLQTLVTTQPNVLKYLGLTGNDEVFTGNYDWHSSVHNHWALLSIARVTHDDAVRDTVVARFTPEVVAHERALLTDPKNAKFEMPYGQGWLLLLLDELSKTPAGARADLAQFRNETETRILQWLEASPFPEYPMAKSSAFEFDKDHMSWLFGFWLMQMSHPSPETAAQLEKLRSAKLDPVRSQIAQVKSDSYDFLYLPAVLSLVDLTSGHAEPEYPVTDDPGFQKMSVQTEHTAGAAMVRIWPHALQSAKSPASCARYQTRMTEMFSRPDQWQQGSLDVVTHWIPQFMWMGMWLELGAP
jgi:hypothetical protein